MATARAASWPASNSCGSLEVDSFSVVPAGMGRLKVRPFSTMIWAKDALKAAAMFRIDSELDLVV